MSKARKILTEGELEIMDVVWELQQCTVRQVYEALRERKRVAYTTVMTMMKILEEKGHLVRSREGRAYVYRPTRPKTLVIASIVNDFVSRVFGGSARPLLLGLLEGKKLSEEDIAEITRLIKEER